MLEERGQVIAIEQGAVRVRVNRQSSCGSCQAKAACGQGLMQTIQSERCHEVRALTDLSLQEGDFVVLGVSEDLLLRSAFMVYLLPLLALIAGAVLGQQLGLTEGWSVLLAGLAFAASGVYLYRFNKRNTDNTSLMPVVLRAELAVQQN